MTWSWLALAATLPFALGLLVARLFWRRGSVQIGNVAGAALILVATLAFGGREYVEVMQNRIACIEARKKCPPAVNDFKRTAVYSCIGFAQIAIVFLMSIRVDEARQRRSRSPEWQ